MLSDSFNKLLNHGSEDSVDSSQLVTKKRGHGGDDVVESSAPPQHRHCNRNTAIGLGLSNNHDAPIELINEDMDDAAVEARKGDAPTINPLVVVGWVPSLYHDSQIVSGSTSTIDTLERLRKDYQIAPDIILSLLYQGYDIFSPHTGQFPIHMAAFECGVKLPHHPTLHRVLPALQLVPLQLTPGFWKNLVGFLVLWR